MGDTVHTLSDNQTPRARLHGRIRARWRLYQLAGAEPEDLALVRAGRDWPDDGRGAAVSGSGTMPSPASSARAGWASSTPRATSACIVRSRLKMISSGPTTRPPASASGARRARRRASTIRTSSRSTTSAMTRATTCSSRWSCSRLALDQRLQKGPMSVSHAVPVALEILAALAALHARGVVHRDLKPSNVFLTPHVVKLSTSAWQSLEPEQALTRGESHGHRRLVGTPGYIAPEWVLGQVADTSSDLFAVGAILFEILAGRPAFGGLRRGGASRHRMRAPPALTGPPAVSAVDRVIRRALAKESGDRPESADEMARELRSIRIGDTGDVPAVAQVLTRLVVLPFRALRADPESDFLVFSLPHAIATSLSGTRFSSFPRPPSRRDFPGRRPTSGPLPRRPTSIAWSRERCSVRGEQVRAAVQLIEAPTGTLPASLTVQSSLGGRVPTSGRHRQARGPGTLASAGRPGNPDARRPARPAACTSFYLRAEELRRAMKGWCAPATCTSGASRSITSHRPGRTLAAATG